METLTWSSGEDIVISSLMLMLAPYLRSSLARWRLLSVTASWRGVRPVESWQFTKASFSNSNLAEIEKTIKQCAGYGPSYFGFTRYFNIDFGGEAAQA